VQASVGSHCVECAAKAQPDLKTRAKYWQAGKPALVTYVLLTLNVGAFVLLGLYYDLPGMLAGDLTEAHVKFGLSPFFLDGEAKTALDPVTLEPLTTSGQEWYRLITSGFLHYGVIHIAFNMLFLFQLGLGMEPQLGRLRFGLLYFASLLGGSAGALVIDQGGITAGASGAVFGLMGAYAIGMWRNGINPFTTSIGSLLLINLFLTFAISNISIGGHLGGAVAGALCGAVLFAPRYRPVPSWAMWATPSAVGAASILIAVVAAGS
jgi:membrane associated rhomboid family serine protease